MLDKKLLNNISNTLKTWGKLPKRKMYSLSTDSRAISENQIFLALLGENFDAYDFLENVLGGGCSVIIFNYTEEREKEVSALSKKYPSAFFIGVENSLTTLQELAEKHILDWLNAKPSGERRLIGITGSNGKTTHKEMLFYLLNSIEKDRVYCTQGNFNNHIGLPLTLLQVDESYDYVIAEMGTNHPGEISRLCEIAHPTDGIITNIGDAHLEFFHTREAIFEEKSQLYEAVVAKTEGKGAFVINRDDILLEKLAPTPGLSTYGERQGDYLVQLLDRGFYLSTAEYNWEVASPNIIERHNLKNLAGCLILAMKLFPTKYNELIEVVEGFKLPENNRSQWIEKFGKSYFLDAYNANPSSMEAALSSFVERQVDLERSLFILGDMHELGDKAPELHAQIGKYLGSLGVKHAAFIGRYAQYYAEGFGSDEYKYRDKKSFQKNWSDINKSFDYFFIKGSRTLQLETLVDIT